MVIFDLGDEDILCSNVIYVVQFGEVVKDFIEGNLVEDLWFVFFIGLYIDFFEVFGQLFDVYFSELVVQVLVMLYDNFVDFVFCINKFFYFGCINEQGQF